MNKQSFPPLDTELALEQLEAHLPIVIGFEKVVAKVTKAKFDALVEEGFTEEQAEMIVCSCGFLP